MLFNKNKIYVAAVIIILSISVILRLQIVNFNRTIVEGDEMVYHYAAENLLKYGCLTMDRDGTVFAGIKEAEPASSLQIGYPIVIAIIYSLFGHNPYYVFVFQFILSILDLFLMYFIMLQCNCKKKAILLTLLFAGIYPGFIYNINRMLTEQVFKTLLLLFVNFLILALNHEKKKIINLSISAVFLGCATFVRGLAFPFAFLTIFIIIFYENKNRLAEIYTWGGVFALSQIWWWIRNLKYFHKFILLSMAGEGPKIWGLMPYYLDMVSSEGKTAIELLTINRQVNFPLYARWRIFGCINYLWNDIWDENAVHSELRSILWIQILIILIGILLPILIKHCNAKILLITSFPISFTLMNMPYHGLPRYLYPSIPFIFIAFAMMLSNDYKKEKNKNEREKVLKVRKFFEKLYFIFSIIFSITLFGSIFIFGSKIQTEMSEWRLNKYADISIADLQSSNLILSREYYKDDIIVENSEFIDEEYINNKLGTSIIKLNCDQTLQDKVITKVEINIRGGYLFDYMTVYWEDDEKEGMNENNCYKFPIHIFEQKHVIYIDSDVRSLQIIPMNFRNGKFKYNSIRISKIAY